MHVYFKDFSQLKALYSLVNTIAFLREKIPTGNFTVFVGFFCDATLLSQSEHALRKKRKHICKRPKHNVQTNSKSGRRLDQNDYVNCNDILRGKDMSPTLFTELRSELRVIKNTEKTKD